MVPIVVMSLAVLVYGLILSLEQRRKEISIHRVIGADSSGLQGMVLLELAVFSSLQDCWIFTCHVFCSNRSFCCRIYAIQIR